MHFVDLKAQHDSPRGRALSKLREIISTGRTQGADGQEIDAHAHCSLAQAEHFVRVIDADETVRRTAEIGCAHGVSSLAIAGALSMRADSHHIILDPMQRSYWKGSGVASLLSTGLTNWELIEDRSEFALPRMVQQGKHFDLIFIDGWHTFDHALLDAFYATRLLSVGGYLALDDTDMPGLWKMVRYLRNYPCFRWHSEVPALLPRRPLRSDFWRNRAGWITGRLGRLVDLPRMVVLQKTAEDDRPWNWYEPF